jgi:DNA-directed RNA polymerase specialized sigma24 family protein
MQSQTGGGQELSAEQNPQNSNRPATRPIKRRRSPSPDADLRRKAKADCIRDLVDRASFLPAADRELLRTVQDYGRPIRELAPILGLTPRALSRKFHKILRRAKSPEYAFVVTHADSWPERTRRVAKCLWVDGLSTRHTADKLRLSLYTVRQHRDFVRGLYAAAQEAARAEQLASPLSVVIPASRKKESA